MAQTSKRSTGVFLWFFIVLGIIVIGVGIRNLTRTLQSKNWPVSIGEIMEAKMESVRGGSHHGNSYSVQITYSYKVGGIHYTGTRLAFDEMTASAAYAQKILDRFPVGKSVPVYYSPGNPGLAVLETGVHGGTMLCLGVGTLFVLAGGFLLQSYRKAETTPTTAPRPSDSQKPPMMMGIMFIFMGAFLCLMQAMEDSKAWGGYAAAGFFVVAGLLILSFSLQKSILPQVFKWTFFLSFLAFLHREAFFSQLNGKAVIAVVVIGFDLILVAGLVQWVVKGKSPFL